MGGPVTYRSYKQSLSRFTLITQFSTLTAIRLFSRLINWKVGRQAVWPVCQSVSCGSVVDQLDRLSSYMFQFKQNLPVQFDPFLVNVLDGCQVSLQGTNSSSCYSTLELSHWSDRPGGWRDCVCMCVFVSHFVVSSFSVDLEISLHRHQRTTSRSFLQKSRETCSDQSTHSLHSHNVRNWTVVSGQLKLDFKKSI